jgi:hypothetical protein
LRAAIWQRRAGVDLAPLRGGALPRELFAAILGYPACRRRCCPGVRPLPSGPEGGQMVPSSRDATDAVPGDTSPALFPPSGPARPSTPAEDGGPGRRAALTVPCRNRDQSPMR